MDNKLQPVAVMVDWAEVGERMVVRFGSCPVVNCADEKDFKGTDPAGAGQEGGNGGK